jgi:hypothetical protein
MNNAHSVGDWLYISGGTLIGALVALLAAYIAWRAIRHQIQAEQENVKAQIAAENNHRKRAERLSVVADAAMLMSETIGWWSKAEARNTEAGTQERNALETRLVALGAKLDLVEMRDESNATWKYWVLMNESDPLDRDERTKLVRMYNQTIADLTKGIGS